MGVIAASIKEKLEAAFNPSQLSVVDESHLHAGHAGAQDHAREHGSGESHFHVMIKAGNLSALSRLARHRAVMDVLAEEMKTVHALRLDVLVD